MRFTELATDPGNACTLVGTEEGEFAVVADDALAQMEVEPPVYVARPRVVIPMHPLAYRMDDGSLLFDSIDIDLAEVRAEGFPEPVVCRWFMGRWYVLRPHAS